MVLVVSTRLLEGETQDPAAPPPPPLSPAHKLTHNRLANPPPPLPRQRSPFSSGHSTKSKHDLDFCHTCKAPHWQTLVHHLDNYEPPCLFLDDFFCSQEQAQAQQQMQCQHVGTSHNSRGQPGRGEAGTHLGGVRGGGRRAGHGSEVECRGKGGGSPRGWCKE